jgi:antitoxin HicB
MAIAPPKGHEVAPTGAPNRFVRVIAGFSGIAGTALQRVAERYGEGGNDVLENTFEFAIKVTPDETDGGFIAECVGLPGVMSQGETEQEAVRNVIDAVACVLEVRLQDQLDAPDFEISDTRILRISLAS